MRSRDVFAKRLAELELTHVERAVALLWYYRQTQQYDERTASELASDLRDEGFPKPQVSRLREGLKRSRSVVRGRRRDSYQLDVRRLKQLDDRYADALELRRTEVSDTVIPSDWVHGTRTYLERMVLQINGSYEYGFFDACAVIARRLMESLIIEVYVSRGRHHEIQSGGLFIALEGLINYIRADRSVPLGRNSPKTMLDVKQLGDTAAHDRTYVTDQSDVDDLRRRYKHVISELLTLAGIKR